MMTQQYQGMVRRWQDFILFWIFPKLPAKQSNAKGCHPWQENILQVEKSILLGPHPTVPFILAHSVLTGLTKPSLLVPSNNYLQRVLTCWVHMVTVQYMFTEVSNMAYSLQGQAEIPLKIYG